MAVKIRLTRLGDKKTPFYRIVVSDSRKSRSGEYVDQIGTFNPLAEKDGVVLDSEKAQKWVNCGAEPTDTVKAILKKNGIEKTNASKKAEKSSKKTTTKKASK